MLIGPVRKAGGRHLDGACVSSRPDARFSDDSETAVAHLKKGAPREDSRVHVEGRASCKRASSGGLCEFCEAKRVEPHMPCEDPGSARWGDSADVVEAAGAAESTDVKGVVEGEN